MSPKKKRMATPDAATVSKEVEKTKRRVEEYVRDPERTKQLLDNALKKAQKVKKNKGPLEEVWNYLMALFRLLQAYVQREYTDIPWGSIVLVIVAIFYFTSPIDLIPDFIPVAGFADDAAVLAFVVAQIRTDLDNFLEWEAK